MPGEKDKWMKFMNYGRQANESQLCDRGQFCLLHGPSAG